MRRSFVIATAAIATCINTAYGEFFQKYDLRHLPFDLRPVSDFVGMWKLRGVKGNPPSVLYAPDLIDIGINPLPKFGARALNVTQQFYKGGDPSQIYRTDFGFLPVKNATKADPRVHAALLTTSSDGFSMMEQGQVRGTMIRLHLKQFMKRTFDMGGQHFDLLINDLERELRMNGRDMLDMSIASKTNHGSDSYTAQFIRIRRF